MSPANELSANHSSFEESSAGYSVWNCSATRKAQNSWHGNYSLEVAVSLAQESASDAYVGLQTLGLLPAVMYTWQARAYLPFSTRLYLPGCYLQELGGSSRVIAVAGTSSAIYPAGFNLISGTGTTPVNWFANSRLVLRPAKKDDNTGWDSTKPIYYDALMVEQSGSTSAWVLGGQDYNPQSFSPDAVLASSGFSNATTPNIAFIQDDPESPDANSFS